MVAYSPRWRDWRSSLGQQPPTTDPVTVWSIPAGDVVVYTTPNPMARFDAMTPEERETWLQAQDEAERLAWTVYEAAREALAAVSDPLARRLLDLHHTKTVEFPTCEGCDDYEDAPGWPCRTVEVLADHLGIELPSRSIWRRPDDAPTLSPDFEHPSEEK